MTKQELTFEGKKWTQLSKTEQLNSMRFCMEHLFDKHVVQHKWICRWLVLYTPELNQRQWRKVLKPLREKMADEQIQLDSAKVHISHIVKHITCEACAGTGYEKYDEGQRTCYYCDGKGVNNKRVAA